MSNGKDRTPVLQNEDWWACFIGWFILLLALWGVLPGTPKIATWTSLTAAFPKGWSTLGTTIVLCIAMGVLTFIGGIFMKYDLKNYIPGFVVIFAIAFISMVISKQAFVKKWGISYVLFALAFGLIISNVFRVPKFLKAAAQTEFFVKIGLVCMGATIMFSVVLKAGVFGVLQAVLVATVVWFGTYWICRKFKISERFSGIIATANAICGVSASIAAGGAVDPVTRTVPVVFEFDNSEGAFRAGMSVNAHVRTGDGFEGPSIPASAIVDDAVRNISERTGVTAEEARRRLASMSPQQRLIEPVEVAKLVGYLVSEEAGGLNGQAINIDGGAVTS